MCFNSRCLQFRRNIFKLSTKSEKDLVTGMNLLSDGRRILSLVILKSATVVDNLIQLLNVRWLDI
jgi:hypothetical protein